MFVKWPALYKQPSKVQMPLEWPEASLLDVTGFLSSFCLSFFMVNTPLKDWEFEVGGEGTICKHRSFSPSSVILAGKLARWGSSKPPEKMPKTSGY